MSRDENAQGLDLGDMLIILARHWKQTAVVAFAVVFVAALYAFVIARPVYVSTALLLPTRAQTPDQLGAAAAILGKKNIGSADQELYQSLLSSRTVIQKLLDVEIRNRTDTSRIRNESLAQVLGVNASDPRMYRRAVENLSQSITVGTKQNTESGILEIRFSAGAPWLAQQIGNKVLLIGQEELRRVNASRAEMILRRLHAAVVQSRAEWDSIAVVHAFYKSQNRSMEIPDKVLQLTRLEMEMEAKAQKYHQARSEYETQMLEVEKSAPPMMILDSADLPVEKSKPQRKVILMLGLFAGIAAGITSVLGKHVLTACFLEKWDVLRNLRA